MTDHIPDATKKVEAPRIPTPEECEYAIARAMCSMPGCGTPRCAAGAMAKAVTYLRAENERQAAEIERLKAQIDRRNQHDRALCNWAAKQPDKWRDRLAVFCRDLIGACVCGAHCTSVVMEQQTPGGDNGK